MSFQIRPAWFSQNDITTGESADYPELKPRVYPQAPDRVYEYVIQAARSLPRWSVVRRDPAARTVHVHVTTYLFGFIDDVTARVEPVEGGSRVVIRSRSRIGKGDLGENARHIAALQRRMDEMLGP